MRTRTSRALPILGSALALAGLTLPALAAEAPSRAEKAAAIEAKLTEAQKRAVAEFRAQFDRNPAPVTAASTAGNGVVRRIQPGDRTLSVAVAKRNPDGTISTTCVDDAAQLAAFLAEEAKAPAKSEAKEQ